MGSARLGSGCVLVVALIFDVVALATPAWITFTSSSCGLFQCQSAYATASIPQGTAQKVASAFTILAMIALLGAAPLVLLAGKNEDKDSLGKIGGLLGVTAGVFILIGIATYTGLALDAVSSITFGYSFVLGWIAFVLALIGGIVALITK